MPHPWQSRVGGCELPLHGHGSQLNRHVRVASFQCRQRRFYDFVVFAGKKRVEKLRSPHRNPVQRGLVLDPEEWLWSSFRHYDYRAAEKVEFSAAAPEEVAEKVYGRD
jgi:hypothetical protein